MKATLTLLAAVLASVSASAAQQEINPPKDFMAFKLGDEKSCEIQINWKRDINDKVNDYFVYTKEGAPLKAEIPFDPTLQPITVVDPTADGQRGIYVVPNDIGFTYVPIQVNYCGDKKGVKFTTFYVKGVNKETKKETKYPEFSISTSPFEFIPSASPDLSDTVTAVEGKKRTYKATWTFDPSPTDAPVAGFWLFYGEKTATRLGSVYVEGADRTNATFTLTNDMKVENVVLSASVLDTKQAISSPTNSREASIVPDQS